MSDHHAPPALGFPVRREGWVVGALLLWWLLCLAALWVACTPGFSAAFSSSITNASTNFFSGALDQWAGASRWGVWACSALLTSTLGLWAGWSWWAQMPGEWFWDGGDWYFKPLASGHRAEPVGQLTVVFDFQRHLLLKALPPPDPAAASIGGTGAGPVKSQGPGSKNSLQWQKSPRWSLVSRAQAPHLWHGFRCAVYSPAAASH